MPLPIIPLIAAGAGIAQSIFGAGKAKKYQRQLDNMQSPTYNPNRGILDFYNQALARYNVNPTESALYKRQSQNIQRNQAAGIMGLNDRRSVLAGLPSLLRASNDAALNTEVAAEQQRDQRFSQLGQATEAKAGEERTAFDVNQMQPFERKFNMLAQRAGAANQLTNTGLSNIFGGLQNYGMLSELGGGKKGNGGFYGTKYGKLYKK